MPEQKWEREYSAGGVVYRTNPELEVLLIMPNKWNEHVPTGKWRLPKGLIDSGETSEQAAVREVFEETGIRGEIENDLGEEKFFFKLKERNVFKVVRFYLMKYVDGDTKPDALEVFEAKWIPIDEAISMLAYKGEKDMVLQAKNLLT